MYRYVFIRRPDGAKFEAYSHALNPSKRQIVERSGHSISESGLFPHECWQGSERVWHYDEQGMIHAD